jgi:hypothetical protein
MYLGLEDVLYEPEVEVLRKDVWGWKCQNCDACMRINERRCLNAECCQKRGAGDTAVSFKGIRDKGQVEFENIGGFKSEIRVEYDGPPNTYVEDTKFGMPLTRFLRQYMDHLGFDFKAKDINIPL